MSRAEPAAVGAAIGTAASVISVRPVVLPAPGRGEDLQVRVTAPTTGRNLPIVVFSHGFGSSMDGYAPLAEQSAGRCGAPGVPGRGVRGSSGERPRVLESRWVGCRPTKRLFGAEHSMGGITGYSMTETTDEDPERVALLQQVTTAYLRSALGLGDDGWSQARTDLGSDRQASGRLESK